LVNETESTTGRVSVEESNIYVVSLGGGKGSRSIELSGGDAPFSEQDREKLIVWLEGNKDL